MHAPCRDESLVLSIRMHKRLTQINDNDSAEM